MLQNAAAHVRAGNFDQADTLCKRLLKVNKSDTEAVYLYGLVHFRRGAYAEAVRLFERCLKLDSNMDKARIRLGNALSANGRFKPAIKAYDRVLKRTPTHGGALAGKADALDRSGDWKAALVLLEPIIASGDEDADIAYIYATLAVQARKFEEAIEVARRQVDNDLPDPRGRRRLHMVMATAYDKLERYDEAFEAASAGHQTFSIPSDDAATVRRADDTVAAFTRASLDAIPKSNNGSDVPIFVVGMPRSGSTLIEQIIAAHPRAHGVGEIGTMPTLIDEMFRTLGVLWYSPGMIAKIDQDVVNRLASRYLAEVRTGAPRVDRIVDKRLDNFEHIGLIARCLPNARIIHARRDPLDTCLSCHLQTLAPAKHPYAANLTSLGIKYREYLRVMDHWTTTLGLPILEVDYETLVGDQETETRRIIDFCGLDWHEACLTFHTAARDVTTVSYSQVRQPMYRTSLGRASHYAAHLGPLREILGQT